jgi:uncharacterized protein (TIGR02001 family)
MRGIGMGVMKETHKAGLGEAKRKLLNTLMLAACAAPAVALAEEAAPSSANPFSANVGIATDYIFRGISQTSARPALQGGIDYAHASGFYAGVWGSNVSWVGDFNPGVSSSLELDTYFGFRNTLDNGFGYDLGFLRYNYPASNYPAGATRADTDEVYAAFAYRWVSAKYSYGLGQFLTVPGAAGTDYLELNASVPLGETGYTLGAHVGRQAYKGAAAGALALAGTDPSYSDYRLSVARELGGFTVTLAYTDTDAPAGGFYTTPAGRDLARGTAVLSVTRAF